jgi:tetratricopeptide (TPR) repeat protein
MGLLGIAIAVLSLGVAYIAKDVPTGEHMLSTFQAAQSFYSEGAYDQAIEKYRDVGDVESALLDDSDILVSVGEVETSVKDAAIYQLGNSHFKVFEEEFRLAGNTRKERARQEHTQRAEEHLQSAVSYFARVEASAVSEKLRVLAQSRIMTCWYSAQRYQDVIREGHKFVEKYPDNTYVVEALYNVGWSYYELKDYASSIAAFTELTERFSTGFQVSRSLFQIGECYYDQGQYAAAIPHYQRLVGRANIGELSERDVQKMQFEKVAGLVDETEYELTAKAQIRIGDCHGLLGDFPSAETAYRTVVTVFAQERRLVEKAYQSLADMYFKNRLFRQCVGAYREAIDRTPNRMFKARMQFQLAQRYTEASKEWGEDHFDAALREYNIYLKGYEEIADQAGYSLANAWYEIGQVHYAKADRLTQVEEKEGAEAEYDAAVAAYTKVLDEYSGSNFAVPAKFNAALARQMVGGEKKEREAMAAYREIVEEAEGDTYAKSAKFQIARLHFSREEYGKAVETYHELIGATNDSTHLDVAHFELGLALRKKEAATKAIEAFLAVRQVAPQFSRSRLEAGRIYLSEKVFDRALEVLNQGLSGVGGEDERAQYHYLLGKVRVGMEDYDRAVVEFTQAIETTPNPVLKEIAYYDRGTSYSRLERYDEAVQDLKGLVDSANERISGPAQRMLGLAYLKLNRQAEAIDSYGRLARTATDPIVQAEYLVLMLELYLELGQYDEAITTGRQVLAMDLEDRKEGRDYWIKEQVYYFIGECQQRLGQIDALMATYATGLKLYPDSYYSPDMAYALGALLFQQDRLDEATERLADFITDFPASPNTPYAYYYLGYAHFNLREFESAQKVFATLAQQYSNAEMAPEALIRAAESAFNLGNFDEAITLYQQLMDSYTDSPFRDDAMYNIAWSFYELKNEEKFILSFERLLGAFPQSEFAPDARFTLGDFYFNKEDYKKALVEYQHVVRDYPDAKVAREVPEVLGNVQEIVAYNEYEQVIAVFSEAVALDKEGKSEQATQKFEALIPQLKELMEKYPATEVEVGALSNLGVCYEFMRRWNEAVQTYDKVIALFEQDKASEEAFKFAKGHRDWIVSTRL